MPIAIIGGGISGLSAAHYLLKAGLTKNIVLLEASNRLGGWVNSIKDPVTGANFEKGPRTVRPYGLVGANTLELVEDLGLATKVVPVLKTHPTAKNRLIYVGGKLHRLPTDLAGLFSTVPPFSRPLALGALKDLFTPRKSCEDDTIYDFVCRRFGEELAEYLVSPLICGICAGDARNISVKFLAPALFEAEQKYGLAVAGLFAKTEKPNMGALANRAASEFWSVWSLEGGLASLTDSLASNLQGVELRMNTPVEKLEFKKGRAELTLEGGGLLDCRHVISSLPATRLAKLVAHQHPKMATSLNSISHVTVAVVNLAYRGQVLKENAFGFLVPPSQKLPILGVIFDSCSFPRSDGLTVLTAMLGGHWFQEYFSQKNDDKHILGVTLDNVNRVLGIEEEPVSTHISVLKDCIPQYTVGHTKRVGDIFSYVKSNRLPLSLIGSSYKGVGINDVIMSSKNAVNHIQKELV
ncbi:hypothetical protein AAG570_011156 [Ranatra chinensis]|uniref:Protoporphyrinogen oxidase n=1 Tax=Ranatra chinensis TaxID=642074 RepID=A0ABD0YLY8_9HEMI